jgi:hypothetical protein
MFISKKLLFCNIIMQRIIKIASLALIAIALVATGCSSTKKSTCGCTGMVGYK